VYINVIKIKKGIKDVYMNVIKNKRRALKKGIKEGH